MGQKEMNRRDFIVKTALGLATAGLSASPVRAAVTAPVESQKIVYRTLGRTNLKIPAVSFGVMNSDSPDLIRKAIDMGIKLLDTAHLYLRGNSEKVIGEILEERKCRDKVYVATKMYFARDKEKQIFSSEGSGRHPGATEASFTEQLNTSLKRLRTDYVDILYLHNCFGPLMPTFEPMIKAFVKARESGKVRFIGISTHSNEPETIRAAVDAGAWDVVLTSYNFMQDHKDEVKKAIAYAAQKGVGVIAMKTQGGAKLNRETQVNHGAALKWVLNDGNVCTTIPGITTFDQMDLDFGVMSDLSLSSGEKRDLKLSSMIKGPLYCQQCGSCTSSCLKAVDIPTLMRTYMYAEGYGNLIHAGLTLDSLPREKGLAACMSCSQCTAVCRQGIRISERLQSLMAMGLAGTNGNLRGVS